MTVIFQSDFSKRSLHTIESNQFNGGRQLNIFTSILVLANQNLTYMVLNETVNILDNG